jgi:hypothetical protein
VLVLFPSLWSYFSGASADREVKAVYCQDAFTRRRLADAEAFRPLKDASEISANVRALRQLEAAEADIAQHCTPGS